MVYGERNRVKLKQTWMDNIILWLQNNEWETVYKLIEDRDKWREINHVSSQSTAVEC